IVLHYRRQKIKFREEITSYPTKSREPSRVFPKRVTFPMFHGFWELVLYDQLRKTFLTVSYKCESPVEMFWFGLRGGGYRMLGFRP
ncbi:MAG: hypothetical protein ACOYVG_15235, partial [Bacteroidota bacterium]